jgi:tetratricopeptide (TPR) repeat protein
VAECSEGREDFDLAFSRYKNITEQDAFNAEAWYGMAVVCEKQEKYDACLPYITKALEIDSSDPEYWNFLADLKEQSGDYDDAIEALDKANGLHPEDMRYWVSKAQLVFKHVDPELGTEVLMEALKICPDNADLHYLETAFMLATGQVSEALNFLQNGLELDYSKHLLLFEQYPEAIHNPRVMDLIQIYGQ